MKARHKTPTLVSMWMLDVFCCALGCVTLLWLLNTRQAGDQTLAARDAFDRLEVLEATGRSIADFQASGGPVIVDPDRARKFVVLPDRAVLAQRINRRFEKMLEEGAIVEVETLLARKLSPEMPAMKAIGVSQIAAMLKGEMAGA